jgi:hypothetical protein
MIITYTDDNGMARQKCVVRGDEFETGTGDTWEVVGFPDRPMIDDGKTDLIIECRLTGTFFDSPFAVVPVGSVVPWRGAMVAYHVAQEGGKS